MGSGDIVLLICPEKEALSLVARYRQALEEFLAYMPRLRQYAWLGGHSIQENGCDPRHQQGGDGHRHDHLDEGEAPFFPQQGAQAAHGVPPVSAGA